MSAPSVQIGEYVVTRMLGAGSFAVVYKAHHRTTGQVVAIKAISLKKLDKKSLENLESEISILKRVRHHNIVRMHDIQKSEKYIYLILEYCGGGDLSRLIRKKGPLPEKRTQGLMKQLTAGLHFLWSNNLIHRDLKPQNLLLTSDGPDAVLKIADFGFARHLATATMAETLCGSPLYMAPEILRYQKYDAKADLWSVGAIMFELLAKRPPFTGANHIQLLANIERQELRLPEGLVVSNDCLQLLRGLLTRNPHMRISFEDYFASPFVRGATPLTVAGVSLGEERAPTGPVAAAGAGGAGAGARTRLQSTSTAPEAAVAPTSVSPSGKPPASPRPAAPDRQRGPARSGATDARRPAGLKTPPRRPKAARVAVGSPSVPTDLSVFGVDSTAGRATAGGSSARPGAKSRTLALRRQGSHRLPEVGAPIQPGSRLHYRPENAPPTPVPALRAPAHPGQKLLPPPPQGAGAGIRRSASANSLSSMKSPTRVLKRPRAAVGAVGTAPPQVLSRVPSLLAVPVNMGSPPRARQPNAAGLLRAAAHADGDLGGPHGVGIGSPGRPAATPPRRCVSESSLPELLARVTAGTPSRGAAGADGATPSVSPGRRSRPFPDAAAAMGSSDDFVIVDTVASPRVGGLKPPPVPVPAGSLLDGEAVPASLAGSPTKMSGGAAADARHRRQRGQLRLAVRFAHQVGSEASAIAELGYQVEGLRVDPTSSLGANPGFGFGGGLAVSPFVGDTAAEKAFLGRTHAQALGLYVKALEMFKQAIQVGDTVPVPGPQEAGDTSPTAQLKKRWADVHGWVVGCFHKTLALAEACAEHVPDDASPIGVDELLYARAMHLGARAGALDLQLRERAARTRDCGSPPSADEASVGELQREGGPPAQPAWQQRTESEVHGMYMSALLLLGALERNPMLPKLDRIRLQTFKKAFGDRLMSLQHGGSALTQAIISDGAMAHTTVAHPPYSKNKGWSSPPARTGRPARAPLPRSGSREDMLAATAASH